MRDWVAWHEGYDDPASTISARLKLVKKHLAAAIDRAPAGPARLLSLCAGQGHDVLGVLPGHRRRDDVTAVLVETDPVNAARARSGAAAAGLARVEVREADAGRPASWCRPADDVVPADVLLLCGIFGNVSAADIERTVTAAPALCGPGATVIWTRHRREPDLTPRIRAWFTAAGFEEVAFGTPESAPRTAVGAGILRGGGGAVLPAGPLFRFGSAREDWGGTGPLR
ncbi:MAG TPA: SAM-dependent methyltransferase [Streptosporangiaceae bacterium]|nr:SAM-dependent methyltransferase [Streptosporangiaceae bacterium]